MPYGFKTEIRRRRTKLRDQLDYFREHRDAPIQNEHFTFAGQEYQYFVHPHNHTWRNERIIEVPIFRELLKSAAAAETLEVGNVLSHYLKSNHDVVDLYELSVKRRIIREDVLDYDADGKYQLILSISTIEHVGWDDKVKRPERVLEVPAKLRQLLAPGGRAVISVPVGYNPVVDEALSTNDFDSDRVVYLRRATADNHWEETDKATALSCEFGSPFTSGNAIALCEYDARK